MRRFDASGDFNRNWDEYKQGFGDASGEYWLGNDYLHYLTSNRAYKLRFDLEDWDGDTRYAEYSSFFVNSEIDNYRLLLGDYTGTTSSNQNSDETNGFLYHNNMQFSTYDRDNAGSLGSCVNSDTGGFWFNGCSRISPTSAGCGAASCAVLDQTIMWKAWRGRTYSLKKIKMMLRRV